MKVQGNRYINNPEMIKNKVEKKTCLLYTSDAADEFHKV